MADFRRTGFTVWFDEKRGYYLEAQPDGKVARLPRETLILRGAYISSANIAGDGLAKAREQILGIPRDLLWLVQSSEGPPSRSAVIYQYIKAEDVRLQDPAMTVNALRYEAASIGTLHAMAWQTDAEQGKDGYFLTGTSGTSVLWRIGRTELDGLGRHVLTLVPTRLSSSIVNPNFSSVEIGLRTFLEDHFRGFQQAVARTAYLDVIDRAYSVTEGVLNHCLHLANERPPKNLIDKLKEARKILDDPKRKPGFILDDYGYHLAHKVRVLHQFAHPNKVIEKGRSIRPEVGMSAATDLSELLVSVGLGVY